MEYRQRRKVKIQKNPLTLHTTFQFHSPTQVWKINDLWSCQGSFHISIFISSPSLLSLSRSSASRFWARFSYSSLSHFRRKSFLLDWRRRRRESRVRQETATVIHEKQQKRNGSYYQEMSSNGKKNLNLQTFIRKYCEAQNRQWWGWYVYIQSQTVISYLLQ